MSAAGGARVAGAAASPTPWADPAAADGAHGPAHGLAEDGAGGACPNCGTVRAGPFCQRCGQAGHIHHDLTGLLHDLAHGVFHFEGRFLATLPLLVRRPGALTWNYVHGQRARFVTPMALFLFAVFLLFGAVGQVGLPDGSGAASGFTQAQVALERASREAEAKVAALAAARARAVARGDRDEIADLDERLAKRRHDLVDARALARRLDGHGADGDQATGVALIDHPLHALRENGALFTYKLKMASYKYSWALIPISLPFIWLLFCRRRDVGPYHHAIFAIHSLSFMTLLVAGLIGLGLLGVPGGWLWFAFLVAAPIHLHRHLKEGYRLGRWSALWRTAVLLLFTAFTTTLFALFLLWLETE